MRAWATATSVICALLLAGTAAADNRSEDDETALLVTSARHDMGEGDYDDAAKSLDRALSLNPRRIDAYVLRATVYTVKKQYADGVRLMRRAIAMAPDNPDVLTTLGTQLMLLGAQGKGDPALLDEGRKRLELVAERWPDRYDAHALLGHDYSRRGEWAKAVAALEAYLKSRPDELAKQDAVEETELGNAYLRMGNAQQARAVYQRALGHDPKSAKAQLGLAWATAATDCRQALPLLVKAAALAERYPELLVVRGRCALALGRITDAQTFAELYLRRRPDAADGHALRGEVLAAAGQLPPARAELEKALALDPTRRLYVLRLAKVERRGGDPGAAAKRLEDAQEIKDGDPEWLLELGESLLAAKRPVDAVAAGQLLVAKRPDDAAGRTLLGEAMLEAGDPAGAIPHLARAFELDPGSTRARRDLAQALTQSAEAALAKGDVGTAEQQFSRAEPLVKNPRVWKGLGLIRIASGRATEALTMLTKANDEAPDWSSLALEGRALAVLKRWPEAQQRLTRSLSMADVAAGEDPKVVPDRRAGLSLELAAAQLDGGDAAAAAGTLEKTLGAGKGLSPALRSRIEEAMVVAARAAATEAMQAGAFDKALKLLEGAEKLGFEGSPQTAIAVRCELALAATGAGRRDLALTKLKQLGVGTRAKRGQTVATCPFPAPADKVATPILAALNEAIETTARAQKAMATLESLRNVAKGPAEPLLTDALRWIGVRAAADAYAHGKVADARRLLGRVKQLKGALRSTELQVNLAVIDLEDGHTDEAIAALEKLADQEPDALIHLGLAYDKKGDSAKALEYFERAAKHSRFPPLKDWIAAKRRIYGGEAEVPK